MLSKPEIQMPYAVACVTALSASFAQAASHSEFTVGNFLEWPMPFQYAKVTGADDEALGTKVNRVSFDTGTAMSAAMTYGGAHCVA